MATLLYCDRGACGPLGAWFCCSSAFFKVSRTPPEVGGATGVVPPGWAGCDWAGVWVVRIEAGLRSRPACQDRKMLVRKNKPASTAVVRVNRLAVPRVDIKPAPPPMPRPP